MRLWLPGPGKEVTSGLALVGWNGVDCPALLWACAWLPGGGESHCSTVWPFRKYRTCDIFPLLWAPFGSLFGEGTHKGEKRDRCDVRPLCLARIGRGPVEV